MRAMLPAEAIESRRMPKESARESESPWVWRNAAQPWWTADLLVAPTCLAARAKAHRIHHTISQASPVDRSTSCRPRCNEQQTNRGIVMSDISLLKSHSGSALWVNRVEEHLGRNTVISTIPKSAHSTRRDASRGNQPCTGNTLCHAVDS